jgi:hypothetical protein
MRTIGAPVFWKKQSAFSGKRDDNFFGLRVNRGMFPGSLRLVAQDVLSNLSASMEHIERLTMPPPPTYL